MARAFIAFAQHPTEAAFLAVPFGEPHVHLAAGETTVRTVPTAELANASSWSLPLDDFRAYVGPFSALELLIDEENLEVTVGPHGNCVHHPTPSPPEAAGLIQVSVQPSLDKLDSCLQWFAVDLNVDSEGRIGLVQLDLYEP